MLLPDPQTVEKDKKKFETDQSKRIEKLNIEETRLVVSINKLHEEERLWKQRVDDFKEDSKLTIRKSVLGAEVEELEKQKAEAMKPVDAILREVEILRNEAKLEMDSVIERKKMLDESEEKLLERIEAVRDIENENAQRTLDLDKREAGIKSAEAEVKRSTESLGKEWVKFHQESLKTKDYIESKRLELEKLAKDVENGRKTNDSVRESNDAESIRLSNERRSIRDAYIALAQAKKHLGLN